MDRKKILAIDFVLIVGTLFAVVFAVQQFGSPVALSPPDDFVSVDKVLFRFEGERISIDDNPEFSSPDEYVAENGLILELPPGDYYWKVYGALFSEVRKLTIVSEIELKLRESGEGYEVVNAGNVNLDVDVYDGEELVKSVVLSPDEGTGVEGDKVVGGQNG